MQLLYIWYSQHSSYKKISADGQSLYQQQQTQPSMEPKEFMINIKLKYPQIDSTLPANNFSLSHSYVYGSKMNVYGITSAS